MTREIISDMEYHTGLAGSLVLTTEVRNPALPLLVLVDAYRDDRDLPPGDRMYTHPRGHIVDHLFTPTTERQQRALFPMFMDAHNTKGDKT